MKTLRTLLSVAAIMLGVSSFAQTVITETSIHVTITGATTREDLGQIASQLHDRGIQFSYQPNFDGNRHIVGIQFQLTGSDGTQGSAAHEQLAKPGQSVSFSLLKTGTTWGVACTGKCD